MKSIAILLVVFVLTGCGANQPELGTEEPQVSERDGELPATHTGDSGGFNTKTTAASAEAPSKAVIADRASFYDWHDWGRSLDRCQATYGIGDAALRFCDRVVERLDSIADEMPHAGPGTVYLEAVRRAGPAPVAR